MKDDRISPYRLIKKDLDINFSVWSVLTFSVSICVFVQCLFSGFTAGIIKESAEPSGVISSSSDLSSAFEGWNLLITSLVSILIGTMIATAVITLLSEHRKDLAILHSLGIYRKDLIKMNLMESLVAGISSYLIGLGMAVLIGFSIDINHTISNELTVGAVPFNLSGLMMIPLIVIVGSIVLSNIILMSGIFNLPLVEVLNYE